MKTTIYNRRLVLRKALLVIATCYIIFLFTGCSPGDTRDKEAVFVFENVTVIDAVDGLRSGQSVVVRGDRIVEVGLAGEVKEPSGSTIVDCNGKYMIPGLWDAHVHLTFNEALIPVMYPLFIVKGITYVRDTGGHLDLLLPLREDAGEASLSKGLAPRVFIAGPLIDGLPTIYDGSTPSFPDLSVTAVSVEQAGFIADSFINKGVDQIKLYEMLKPDAYYKILSIANSKGYKVSAHVPLSMDVIEASNAGLGSMEHMRNLELSCSSDWETLLKTRQQMLAEGSGKSGGVLRGEIYSAQRMHAFQTQDEERRRIVLKCLADNKTWQVPTLTLVTSAEYRMFSREDYRETFRYLPEPTRSEWEKSAISRADQPPSETGLAFAKWGYDMVPRLAEAGIGIMAGTDAPISLLTPGFSLHEELALLVRAGLTPMQAIESATLRPAQFFGIEDQQGSIGKGMMADLVILDANPLEEITNTQLISTVMRNGHFHSRDDLDEILAQLEKHGKLHTE